MRELRPMQKRSRYLDFVGCAMALGVGFVAAFACFWARSWRAYSPRLMEWSARLPRIVWLSGEVMKSK